MQDSWTGSRGGRERIIRCSHCCEEIPLFASPPSGNFPSAFRRQSFTAARIQTLKTAGPRFQTDQIKTFPGSFSRANFSHIPSLTFFSVNKLVFCEEFIKVSLERKHHIFLLAAAAVIGVVMEAFYMQRRSGPSHAHMSHVSLAGLVAAEMGKACLGNEATGLPTP